MQIPVSVIIAVGAIILSGNAITASAAPLMKVIITPGPMDEAVNRSELQVKIIVPSVDAAAGVPLFDLPPATLLTVTDAHGAVAGVGGQDRDWLPSRHVTGKLTISYRVLVANTSTNGGTTPFHPRIDGNGFSATGMTFLAVPDIKTPYRIRIEWHLDAMGSGATAVSSAGDGDAELPAGPVSRLRLTAFMAGELFREPPSSSIGRFSAAWSGDPGFDLHAPMQWANKLHGYMTKFFQTTDDPPYRVFLRRNGAGNPGGGAAFPNSFFYTFGPTIIGESMKGILGHEMTHTFTQNALGNWYVEGDAVYYQIQLPWRAGMMSTETYLRDINLTAARYYTNAEIGAPEERIIPNFFKDPWMTTLGYDRGALYFATLNGKIRRASDGKRSVDDLVRVLVHMDRTGQTITEATWVDLVRKEIGEDGVADFRAMLTGGIVIPRSEDYGPCFRRVGVRIRRYELGFTAKAAANGKKQVAGLVDGSEAAKAGVRNGDDMVLPAITTEGVKRDPAATMTVQVTRDGKLIPITFLPRGAAAFDAYQWERVSSVPESACRP